MLDSVWAALGGDPRELARLEVTGPRTTLASTFAVTDAATAAVGASLLAATLGSDAHVAVDTRQLAVAVRSERMGSKVKASISKSALFNAANNDSMTIRGRKVAMTSTAAYFPR